MKAHSQEFKDNIKRLGRQLDSIITYEQDGETIELGKENLNSITPHYESSILKSAMKQLDIDSNVEIPLGTILTYQFGVKIENEYEYISYGNYIVYSVEKQEDTNSYKITCYDKMLFAMIDYENMGINYPITVRDYINAICGKIGLTFKNENSTFANYNRIIQTDLYSGLGYTVRDVLDELAQVTASTICINEEDDELEIRYITDTNDAINEEYLKDINVNFGESYGPINTIILSRSANSDKVYRSYPENLSDEDKNAIEIKDNQIMNFNDRADYLPDILYRLNGLTYYLNDFSSTGITYYNLCDRYSVQIGENTYSCVMFNDEINVTQGLEENIHTEMPEETETDYTKADKTDRKINQTYLIVDKQNQTIESVVSQTIDTGNPESTVNKVSRLTQRVDSLESEISNVTGMVMTKESPSASVKFEDSTNESEPITIKVYPIGTSISYLYPRNNLYPSSTLYLTNRKIRFHNNTTSENIDYELPDDLLYYDSEHYDEFYLDLNSQTCQVTKRCKYNADGTVELLASENIISYTYPLIELTEGAYTISLSGYNTGYISVTLMAKNIYTDQFYTKVETDSKISQTAEDITLNVNRTLSNYSTTAQMNSQIQLTATDITSTVSETYATKNDTTSTTNPNSLSSRIRQTARDITLQVNNGSTSSGITIGITKEDGTTSEATGTITMNGLVKFTDLSTSGATTINGANIQTGTLSADKITTGTLSANRISGGTIDASAINLGSGKFKVTTGGVITAVSGTVSGWNLSSDRLYGNASQGGTSKRWSIRPYGVSNDTDGISYYWGHIVSSSDKRLKNNIKQIEEKYEMFFNNLKPVTFNFSKLDDGNKHIGFIAQDILESQDLIDEKLAMVEETPEGYYNLRKDEIIALNTWQIQKLKEEIKLLKEEIQKLKEEK